MTPKIEALIVDDEYDGRIALSHMLEKYCPNVKVVGLAEGVSDAYALISNLHPQLVFLDIRMDDGTAFDLLKKFTSINFNIIFVTAYDEYALEAIRFSALDYLLKPVNPTLLVDAVQKVSATARIDKLEQQLMLLLQDKNKREKIALPTSDGLLFIRIAEILRCESDGSYTRFVLLSGKSILVTRTMKEFEMMLPESDFFRIHKSHLINTNFIKQYVNHDGAYVVMENNDSVPIARNRKDTFLRRLNR